jgi:hypothetical protein
MKLIDIPGNYGTFRAPHVGYAFIQRVLRPDVIQHIFYSSLISPWGIQYRTPRPGGPDFDKNTACDEWVAYGYRNRVMGTKQEFWGFGHGAD